MTTQEALIQAARVLCEYNNKQKQCRICLRPTEQGCSSSCPLAALQSALEAVKKDCGASTAPIPKRYAPNPRMPYLCVYCNRAACLKDADVVVDSYLNVCHLACFDKEVAPNVMQVQQVSAAASTREANLGSHTSTICRDDGRSGPQNPEYVVEAASQSGPQDSPAVPSAHAQERVVLSGGAAGTKSSEADIGLSLGEIPSASEKADVSASEALSADGYAWRYPDCIRFNNGRSVNGSGPIGQIPFYYEQSVKALTKAATIRALEQACGLVCEYCAGTHVNGLTGDVESDINRVPFFIEKQYVSNCGEMEGYVHKCPWGELRECAASPIRARIEELKKEIK